MNSEECRTPHTILYMRQYRKAGLVAWLALVGVASLWAETPENIAANIVYARGGMARIQNIQTERMIGTILVGDQQGSFLREVKRPGKIRMEITLGGKTTVETYDGAVGWKLDGIAGNGQARHLAADEKSRLAEEVDVDGPFADFATKGTRIEVLDKEMLGPSLVWKLKVTPKSGKAEFYYVESTGYYILLRENTHISKDGTTTSDTLYKDFRRVEGILFPFSVVSSSNKGGPAMTLQFQSVEVNRPISDSDFGLLESSGTPHLPAAGQ